MELNDFNQYSDNAGASECKTEQPAAQTEQLAAQPQHSQQTSDEFFSALPVCDGSYTKTYGNASYAEDNSRYDNSFFSIPEEDYKPNGDLKPVRKRMLKTLLKYEFKALFPSMAIGVGLVLGVALVLFISGWFVTTATKGPSQGTLSDYPFYWALAFMLFAYASLYLMIVPIISANKRYSKSFFKSEGYLTFSIPASADEHLLAKHISAFVAHLVALFSVLIGIILALSPVVGTELFTGIFGLIADAFRENVWRALSDLLHILISTVVSPALFFTFCGAFQCWGHRGVQKRTIVLAIVGAYVGFYVLIAFLAIWANDAIYRFLDSAAFQWLSLVVEILLVWFFYTIEKKTLTKKLNLK